MMSPLAAHFADLRERFPDRSASLITKAQRSFEAMRGICRAERPPGCRSAAFEIGGTDFLVWEMDEAMDRFEIFATIYHVPIGALRLSSKPSGMLVVQGFYIDLGKLAEQIETHFKAAKNAAALADRPKNNLLLFGFCKSLGHHLWNEISGLASALQIGLLDAIDGVIVGPFDYFNLAPLLQAKGKQVWKLGANGVIVTPDRLLAYRNNVVTAEARQMVLGHAATQAANESPDGEPAICFQVRRRSRPWTHEAEKLAGVIAACAAAWPNACFLIDGHSASPGILPLWQQDIYEETACFEDIKARLPGGIRLRSLIGMDLNRKINLLKNVDLCVGPIGSAGALSSWLLRKPTICYGPTALYDMMEGQEASVPEGGSKLTAVPRHKIQNPGSEDLAFDLDSSAIIDCIFSILNK